MLVFEQMNENCEENSDLFFFFFLNILNLYTKTGSILLRTTPKATVSKKTAAFCIWTNQMLISYFAV